MRSFPILFLLIFSGCLGLPKKPVVSNPFPVSNVQDQSLVENFQNLSIDSRLLSYTLMDVRRGTIPAEEDFQVSFVVLANYDLALVVGCGSSCSELFVSLSAESKDSTLEMIQDGQRALAYYQVGGRPEALIGTIRLGACRTSTCPTYVALYARAR